MQNASGSTIYTPKTREDWLAKLPNNHQASAEVLFEQYDAMCSFKKKASKLVAQEMVRHRESRVLKSCPGLGPVRAAQLMSVVISRKRFRTKRQFWSYSGLSVITRSSSDWVQTPNGWRRSEVIQTRGLNRSFNRTLKNVFKGAATTIIDQRKGTLYESYLKMLDNGTKPTMAKLTLARKIAAITLVLWKRARCTTQSTKPTKDKHSCWMPTSECGCGAKRTG